jgi:hypothetical protein
MIRGLGGGRTPLIPRLGHSPRGRCCQIPQIPKFPSSPTPYSPNGSRRAGTFTVSLPSLGEGFREMAKLGPEIFRQQHQRSRTQHTDNLGLLGPAPTSSNLRKVNLLVFRYGCLFQGLVLLCNDIKAPGTFWNSFVQNQNRFIQ